MKLIYILIVLEFVIMRQRSDEIIDRMGQRVVCRGDGMERDLDFDKCFLNIMGMILFGSFLNVGIY